MIHSTANPEETAPRRSLCGFHRVAPIPLCVSRRPAGSPGRVYRREDRLPRAVQSPAGRRRPASRLLHHQRQADHLWQLPRRSPEQVGRDRPRRCLCRPGEQRRCAGVLLRLPHGERAREPCRRPAGWNTVQDTAYHDVQCESCHGPGVDHVETPDASAHPLARVRAPSPTLRPATWIRIRPPSPAPAPSAIAASTIPSSTSGDSPPTREPVEEEDGSSSRSWRELRQLPRRPWGAQGVGRDRQLRRADTAAADDSPRYHLRRLPRPPQRPDEGQLRFSISEPSFEANSA